MNKSKELLDRYVEAVLAAPDHLHLTATREAGDFWQRHVLDALKLLQFFPPSDLKKTMKILDLGSGNGVPGIPIAISVPDWSVFLLDSNNKKCGFLDMFCKNNVIKNVTILPGRAEILGRGDQRESFDVVFARAFGKLPSAIELAAPFIKVSGKLIVPHGTSWNTEVAKSKKTMEELGIILQDSKPYNLGSGANFVALFFEKIKHTPDEYPRAVGAATKRPL